MLSKEKAMDGVRLFVFDMDGTVYLGDQPIEGSIEFIREVEAAKDRDYIFFTNNASKVSAVYVEKLRKMGLEVPLDKVVTAGDVCAEYLKVNYPGARIYLNGTPVLEKNWKEKGLKLVEEDPDVCVQSFDTTVEGKHMMPDCGAMCSLITDSTGVKPRFLGKPWKETVDMITEITGYKPEEIAFVGDRLYTDVRTGVDNGCKGFLVLTGEADLQTVAESEVKPTCIYESLNEMRKYL